jgi:hypothetical protein
MKSELINEYCRLMTRTRWLGIMAALGLLVLVLGEIVGELQAVALAERPSSLALNFEVLVSFFCSGLLIAVLSLRSWLLLNYSGKSYSLQLGSWVAVVVPLIGFFFLWTYDASPSPAAPCIPEPGKVCFGIYDMTRTSNLVIATPIFIALSAVRSLITLAVAYWHISKKLK